MGAGFVQKYGWTSCLCSERDASADRLVVWLGDWLGDLAAFGLLLLLLLLFDEEGRA